MFSYENDTPKNFLCPLQEWVSARLLQSTEQGCVGRRQPCSSTPCNCAALVTTCAWPGSLKGQAAAHQLSSGILPLAFKSCVFQTAQESGACCPVKGRSSSRGQPALLRPAFPPSCSAYEAPASQWVRLRKATSSQVLIIPLLLYSLLFPLL